MVLVDTPRKKPRKGAPLSRHPLFPAIVALWFGALFGLGSLALRPALVEQFVIAAGIDTLIPATAPPLGTTTRILIALAMTGLGALLGGSLARRIARPAPEVRQRRRGATSAASETIAPRALSRDDYFGAGAGLEAARDGDDLSLQGNKRRSLALSDDVGPLEIHETAPVPGSSHGGAPVEPLDLAAWDVPAASPRQDQPARFGQTANTEIGDELDDDIDDTMFVQAAIPAEPLDLADLPETGHRPFAPPTFAPSSFTPPSFAPPAFTPSSFAAPERESEPRPFAVPSDAIWFNTEAPEAEADELEAAQLPEDATPEFSSNDPVQAQVAEPVAEATIADPSVIEARAKPVLTPPVGAAAERLVASDFDELSPVQLVERLAISLQRRRQAVAAGAVPAALNPAPSTDIAQPALPQPAIAPLQRLVQPALGAPVQPPALAAAAPLVPLAMPAALRPLDFEAHADEDEDLDETALDFLPPRQFSWQAQPAAEPLFGKQATEAMIDEEPEHLSDPAEAVDLEESYSSLLDLSRPGAQRASFIRIEDSDDDDGMVEPVVVFPGQRTPLATPVGGSPAASQAPAAPAPGSVASAAARLFDRPSDSSAIPARSVDQEEADRALRAALATLQRMSGAA